MDQHIARLRERAFRRRSQIGRRGDQAGLRRRRRIGRAGRGEQRDHRPRRQRDRRFFTAAHLDALDVASRARAGFDDVRAFADGVDGARRVADRFAVEENLRRARGADLDGADGGRKCEGTGAVVDQLLDGDALGQRLMTRLPQFDRVGAGRQLIEHEWRRRGFRRAVGGGASARRAVHDDFHVGRLRLQRQRGGCAFECDAPFRGAARLDAHVDGRGLVAAARDGERVFAADYVDRLGHVVDGAAVDDDLGIAWFDGERDLADEERAHLREERGHARRDGLIELVVGQQRNQRQKILPRAPGRPEPELRPRAQLERRAEQFAHRRLITPRLQHRHRLIELNQRALVVQRVEQLPRAREQRISSFGLRLPLTPGRPPLSERVTEGEISASSWERRIGERVV